MNAASWTFSTLVLDQIPFFNETLFELVVDSMPNLKAITISRCILLDVTKLKPLLEVIERHPRAANPERFIAFDFFPYFFRGPNSAKRLGSYGVTYHEPTFHTPKAVFCLILQCWDLAQRVGMDLLSDSSLFWSFVRKLPGHDILWAVKARDALITRLYDRAEGRKSQAEIEKAYRHDLMAALNGDECVWDDIPQKLARFLPQNHHDREYWQRDARCNVCLFFYPMSLFDMRPGVCCGCKMVKFRAEMEDSHNRQWQDSALAIWTRDMYQWGEGDHQTLGDLPSGKSPALKATRFDVNCADWTFQWFMKYKTKWEYCPPPPEGLNDDAKSLRRWRWHRHYRDIKRFDYRQGGPQLEDPCKDPLSTSYLTENLGPETERNFRLQFRCNEDYDITLKTWLIEEFNRVVPWNISIRSHDDARLRRRFNQIRNDPDCIRFIQRMQWLRLIATDLDVHARHFAAVEDSIWSLGTPGMRPFNIDEPIPHPRTNEEAFRRLVTAHLWKARAYGGMGNHYW